MPHKHVSYALYYAKQCYHLLSSVGLYSLEALCTQLFYVKLMAENLCTVTVQQPISFRLNWLSKFALKAL